MSTGPTGPLGKGIKHQLWGQEVKAQGQTRLSVDYDPWRRHYSPLGSCRFSTSFLYIFWLSFSPRDATHSAACVCLSDPPSVTFVYCMETSKYILKRCYLLVAPPPYYGSSWTVASNAGGYKKSRFSTNILLYLRKDKRQSQSYCETSIRTLCDVSKWYHFLSDPNLDFQVTTFFNVSSSKLLQYKSYT